MKTKLTETKFKSALGRTGQLFSRVVWLGAAILICSSASAQNMFVSGTDLRGGEIFKFSWDGKQSIFASGLNYPGDLAVDSAGNLFVLDRVCSELFCDTVIYKMTGPTDPPNGGGYFASGLSYPSYLAVDNAGNLFVADNSLGNGNIYQGSIYKYKPDGSRVIFALLDSGERPVDLTFDSMGNLYLADLGGKIYKYDLNGVLRRHGWTIFGSVPNSAQSLAFDSAGNLFVVDAGDVSGNGNAIYKFTTQGARSTFAKGVALSQTLSYVAFQPMPVCCQ
jgi:sugar lactone lactonase YvrE